MALDVEGVVDGGVCGKKFLSAAFRSEASPPTAAAQKLASLVFDSRHARTARLAQSMIATQIEEAARHRNVGVSRPKGFHLRPLSEPDMNLAAHPAPIIHPTTDSPSTNGPMRRDDVAPAV